MADGRPEPELDLSARELEVLGLLSTGKSNAEIGAELYIGVETVKTHLSTIYRKLGVARRGEAVAWLMANPQPGAEPAAPVTEVTTEVIPDGVKVTMTGEFDITTVHLMAEALDTARERHPRSVVVDMSGVAFIDSGGIRALVAFRSAAPDVAVTIVDPSPSVRRVLEFSGLAEVFGLDG